MIIEKILQRDEGKTLEFKRDLSSSQKLLKALVAFANTAGGGQHHVVFEKAWHA